MRRRRIGGGLFGYDDWEEGDLTEMQVLVPEELRSSRSDTPQSSTNGRPAKPRVWVGVAGRCKRCCTYFKDRETREGTPCHYHPGKFTNTELDNLWTAWTCCKNPVEDSEGCRIGSSHVQCRATLEALQHMEAAQSRGEGGEQSDDIVTVRIKECMQRENSRESMAEGSDERPPPQAEENQNFWEHEYKPGETLPGLALAYGVSVQDIKRCNKIMGDFLDPGRKFLMIPKKGAGGESQPQVAPVPKRPPTRTMVASRLVQEVAKEGLVANRDEALFYLSDHNDDYDAALAAMRSDLEWGRKNLEERKRKELAEQCSDGENPFQQLYSMFKEAFAN